MIEFLSILFTTILFTSIIFLPNFKRSDVKNLKIQKSSFDLKVLNILIILNIVLILTLAGMKISHINLIAYLAYISFLLYFFFNLKNYYFEKNLKYFLIIFISIVFIFSIDLSYNLTLFWDAKKMWLPKALVFYNDGSISDLKETAYSHYSFYGSLVWAFFWKFSNISNEYIGRIFYIVIFCFALFNFLDLSKVKLEKKIIYFLLLNLLIYNYWHFRGTQEILVFSFLLICSKYLYKIFFQKELNIYNLILVFLSLNLIIWTKNEGIILGLIIIFLFAIFLKKNLSYKVIISTIFIILVFTRFILFKFYGLDTNLSKDFDFKNIFEIFYKNISFKNLFLIIRDKNIFKKCYFLYVYLFLSISLIFVVYLSSSQDMEFMLSTGALRLMFEFSSPYLLFIYIFFKETYKKIES